MKPRRCSGTRCSVTIFIIGLQEGRKTSGIPLRFQQPNIIDRLGVGGVIRGQCQTRFIFFRNPQAMAEDYVNWNPQSREIDFVFGRSYRDFPYAIFAVASGNRRIGYFGC